MTAHFQFFMILGCGPSRCLIIFALLKRPNERKIQPSLAGTGRSSCHLCGIPLCCLRPA